MHAVPYTATGVPEVVGEYPIQKVQAFMQCIQQRLGELMPSRARHKRKASTTPDTSSQDEIQEPTLKKSRYAYTGNS